MDKNECADLYSESETEEHINGKRDLYEWIKRQNGVTNAVLEGWIPETKQRPDIMFEYNGQKYVIEYQCTPIATEYVERHELYKAVGIIDIWILGAEKYLKPNMREKYISIHAIGFYDSNNKSLILNNLNEIYAITKLATKMYYTSQFNYYGRPLIDFKFNGFILDKKIGNPDEIKTKRSQRKKYHLEENKKNYYLKKQEITLFFKLEENLKRLTNNNWTFGIGTKIDYYYGGERKTRQYIYARPIIRNSDGSYHYYLYEDTSYPYGKYSKYKFLNGLGKPYKKMYLDELTYEEYKKCSRNSDFLKSLLCEIMKYNISVLLSYEGDDIRYIRGGARIIE